MRRFGRLGTMAQRTRSPSATERDDRPAPRVADTACLRRGFVSWTGICRCLGPLILVAALVAGEPARAEVFQSKAAQAYVLDISTGTVLYAHNPDQPFPPAALTKLMTMEIVFGALAAGTIRSDDAFPVSEDAWRRGGAPSRGATMFAALKSSVPVTDLMQGVVVQGANDGCLILAEGMAGGEAAFVAQMNARAAVLGLEGTTFRTATGLAADGQLSTARDLTALARHLWQTYPQYYPLYAQREFTWNKITQRNRNPLLAMDLGGDGLGTGAAEGAGYALVGSAERGGRRIFMTLAGFATERERTDESRRLLHWAFDGFERRELFAQDSVVGSAGVFGGTRSSVDLRTREPIAVLIPKDSNDAIEVRVVYNGPVPAPVVEGQRIASLQVWRGKTLSHEAPLYAGESVELGSLHRRAFDAIAELLIGWMRRPTQG